MMSPTEKQSSSQSKHSEEVKIVIVGDTKVGKTTIVQSLLGTEDLGRGYSVSLTLELKKNVSIIGRIYDLRSQRYFPYLHSLYYHGAKGAIIVFDVTCHTSFKSIKKWLDIIWGHVGSIPILLCGNKSDLRYNIEEQVTIDEIKELIKTINKGYANTIYYLEISALKNIIAHSEIQKEEAAKNEDIYPTTEAFRKPFINWLFEIIKKG